MHDHAGVCATERIAHDQNVRYLRLTAFEKIRYSA